AGAGGRGQGGDRRVGGGRRGKGLDRAAAGSGWSGQGAGPARRGGGRTAQRGPGVAGLLAVLAGREPEGCLDPLTVCGARGQGGCRARGRAVRGGSRAGRRYLPPSRGPGHSQRLSAAGLPDRRTPGGGPVGEGRQRRAGAPDPRSLPGSRPMRRWRGKALLVCLLAAWMLLGTGGVMADSSSPPTPSPQGIDGQVPPPSNIQQGNQPTLAERYPTTAYTPFAVSIGGAVRDARPNPGQSPAQVMFTVAAGAAMEGLLNSAVPTSPLLEWTFSVDVVGTAGGPVTQVVQTLADQVYRPLIETALVLGGLWLVWHLLIRRRTMYSFQGVAWALVAMVAAGVYFAAPVPCLSTANNLSAAASREM